MKSYLLLVYYFFFSLPLFATQITIIESSQSSSWSVQDTVWKFVSGSMGYNATIVPQSTLESITNLNGTDVLIVSSATKGISSQYFETIKQFILSGRPAYIQTEYVASASGNVVFDSLMSVFGADFHWTGTLSGQLTPMLVSGTFSSTPDSVNALNYFNAGQSGTGTGVEKFLEFNGSYYGFCYTDPVGIVGTVITTSDQDWIWRNESPELIKNILFRLVQSVTVSTSPALGINPKIQIYPNPVEKNLSVSLSLEKPTRYCVFDISGKCFLSGILKTGLSEIPTSGIPVGSYSLFVEDKGVVKVIKR